MTDLILKSANLRNDSKERASENQPIWTAVPLHFVQTRFAEVSIRGSTEKQISNGLLLDDFEDAQKPDSDTKVTHRSNSF
jgi:hypothetical protein